MVSDPAVADLTLDELRARLAAAIAAVAGFDGWGDEAIAAAADAVGVDRAAAAYAFRGGAMDMIAAWTTHVDAAMAAAFTADALAALPMRERIRRLVRFRLASVAGQRESLRRALAIMAQPVNTARAVRLGWRTADAMWRLAGDTATDYNHYSKRAILGGIYAATLAVLVGDDSEGQADTMAFLDRRIEGIMRFEKAKGQLLRPTEQRFSMVRLLGRLRYPAT
ncbi:MAG: COQ9 family protein [Novosphingobium sp.]|jgi:ubiquinone biosynthesis protein COQ9|nr:COQ9 family protein [Novosphingobium sp.]